MMLVAPIAVAETPEFLRFAERFLSNDQHDAVIDYLANNPTAGVLIKGAGGLRKLRWAARGRGKRGGVRVIYYYHDDELPVFLIAGFAKSDKDNISRAAQNDYRRLVAEIVETYKGNRK